MDSIRNSPYWPVAAIFIVSFILFIGLFWLLWRSYWGPKTITDAIKERKAPSAIRSRLAKANWIWAGGLAIVLGGVLTFMSWLYFGAWMYSAAGDSLEYWATWFYKSVGILEFARGDLEYNPFIPLVCIVALMIGVLAGAILGKQIGVRHAARKYHLTKNLFLKKGS